MVDEITPVEAARGALFMEMDDCLERMHAQRGKGSGRLVELTDALIAAVRAEHATPLDAAEALFGVVANVRWDDMPAEWVEAAIRARDLYHQALRTAYPPRTVEDYGRLL